MSYKILARKYTKRKTHHMGSMISLNNLGNGKCELPVRLQNIDDSEENEESLPFVIARGNAARSKHNILSDSEL